MVILGAAALTLLAGMWLFQRKRVGADPYTEEQRETESDAKEAPVVRRRAEPTWHDAPPAAPAVPAAAPVARDLPAAAPAIRAPAFDLAALAPSPVRPAPRDEAAPAIAAGAPPTVRTQAPPGPAPFEAPFPASELAGADGDLPTSSSLNHDSWQDLESIPEEDLSEQIEAKVRELELYLARAGKISG